MADLAGLPVDVVGGEDLVAGLPVDVVGVEDLVADRAWPGAARTSSLAWACRATRSMVWLRSPLAAVAADATAAVVPRLDLPCARGPTCYRLVLTASLLQTPVVAGPTSWW